MSLRFFKAGVSMTVLSPKVFKSSCTMTTPDRRSLDARREVLADGEAADLRAVFWRGLDVQRLPATRKAWQRRASGTRGTFVTSVLISAIQRISDPVEAPKAPYGCTESGSSDCGTPASAPEKISVRVTPARRMFTWFTSSA